jgi:hypothetical protein
MALRQKSRPILILTLLVAIIAAILSLTGCGSDDKVDYTSQSTCFKAIPDDQLAQAAPLAQGPADPSTPQKYCLVQQDGTQRFYDRNDGGPNALLWLALAGRGMSLSTYTLLAGGDTSDVIDAMILENMLGVNPRGQVFSPYSYTDAGWARQPQVVNNYTNVTNVQVGNGATTKYDGKAKPPAGVATMPKATDQVADLSVGANGKPNPPKVEPGVSAKAKVAKAKPVAPPVVNKVTTAPTVPNTAVKPTTAPAPTTTPAPKPTTVAPATPPAKPTVAPTPPKQNPPSGGGKPASGGSTGGSGRR